jgi:hypothetical protein
VYILSKFALCPDKTSGIHTNLFNKHKDRGVSPSVFAIDFENATKTAIETVFHTPEITDANFIQLKHGTAKRSNSASQNRTSQNESEVRKWLI